MKKIKQFYSTLLAISILSNSVVFANDSVFSDISNHWAKDEILDFAKNDLIFGYDGKFSPDDYITRGQFAVILDRIMGYQGISEDTFSDLDDNYYTDALLKANNAGIILGSGTDIMPNGYATREQIATMICRAMYFDTSSYTNSTFADNSQISDYALSSVAFLQAKGIINGVGDNNYNPQGNITRAELVCILDRTIDLFIFDNSTYSNATYENVLVNTSNATLENLTITGDLILAEGINDGDVTLNNVTVHGNIVIKGGGENSVYFNEVTVNGVVIIEKEYGAVRVVTSGDGSITSIEVYGEVIINAENSFSSIDNIVIKDATDVTLIGNFEQVTNEAENSNITVTGTIDNIIMTETGSINNNTVVAGNELDKVPTSDVLTTPDSSEDSSDNSSSSSGSSSGSSSSSTYSITIDDNIENGSISTDVSKASLGQKVTITATPDSGYELESITVTNDKYNSKLTVTDNSFTMSISDVTVSATFVKSSETSTPDIEDEKTDGKYMITIDEDITNGVIQTNQSTGDIGDVITITATPNSGYKLQSLSVTNSFGSPMTITNNQFTMTISDVVVSATFVKNESEFGFTLTEQSGITGGTISINKDLALENDQIIITATPDNGYYVSGIYYILNGSKIYLSEDINWFLMPSSDIYYGVDFELTSEAEIPRFAVYGGSIYKELTDLDLKVIGGLGLNINYIPEPSEFTVSYSNGSNTLTKTPDDVAIIESSNTIRLIFNEALDCTSASSIKATYIGSTITDLNGSKMAQNDYSSGFTYIDSSAPALDTYYNITTDCEFITINKTSAIKGSEITILVHEKEGYSLTSLQYIYDDVTTTINNYTFNMPSSDIEIIANYEAISYNIYPNTLENGTVSASETSAIIGSEIIVDFTVNTGYELEKLYYIADGKTVDITQTDDIYSFIMPASDIVISADFKLLPYSISVDSSIKNGSISLNQTTAKMDDEINLEITQNEGYQLSSLTYTYNNITTEILDNSFIMPAFDVVISASFERISYNITANTTNGTIEPSSLIGKIGDEIKISFSADSGYELEKITYSYDDKIIDLEQNSEGIYSFIMPAYDVEISGIFVNSAVSSHIVEIDNFITNGVISTNKNTASESDNIIITVTPNDGYRLSSLTYTYNNGSPIEITNFSFVMPDFDVEITASFEKISYIVSVDTLNNGTISVNSNSAEIDDIIEVSLNLDNGYEISKLFYTNGIEDIEILLTDDKYTFTMPASDIEISAVLKLKSYDISVDTIENGSIDVQNSSIMDEKIEITVNSVENYRIKTLSYTYNSQTIEILETDGVYSFIMPTFDVVISAIFEEIPSFDITIDANMENGIITVENSSVKVGEEVIVTITPSSLYELSSLSYKINDEIVEITQNEDNLYSFIMPESDIEIFATFVEASQEFTVLAEVYDDGTYGKYGKISIDKATAEVSDIITITLEETSKGEVGLLRLYYVKEGSTEKIYIPATSPLSSTTTTATLEMVDANITIYAEFTDAFYFKTGAGTYVSGTEININFYSNSKNLVDEDTLIASEFKLKASSTSSTSITPSSVSYTSTGASQTLTLKFSQDIYAKLGTGTSSWYLEYFGETLENIYGVKMLPCSVKFSYN